MPEHDAAYNFIVDHEGKPVNWDAVDRAIETLNRALLTDPSAVHNLALYRVECNAELKDDPTIQAGDDGVRLIGLVNGLFGATKAGWGFISMTSDPTDPDGIVKFERVPVRYLIGEPPLSQA